MSKTKKRNSIDDATPKEWDETNWRHFNYNPEPEYVTFNTNAESWNILHSLSENLNVDQATWGDLGYVTEDFNPRIEYKFREGELIEEFRNYINQTYSGHYGQGGLQSSEVIVDRGHGMGFFLGNVDKYNGRYGKKGTPEDARKDLMKIIHYGFLALYEHDRIHGNNSK
jgi:hypothetical protein